MEDLESRCASLRAQIAATETQLAALKRELEKAKKAAALAAARNGDSASKAADESGRTRKWPLLKEEYKRYGRQMIVPQIGLQGWSSNCGLLKRQLPILMYCKLTGLIIV